MTRIDPRIIHVIRLMERHRKAPLPVETLAREVNVSASYLTRLFRTQLGISPAQFDKHARLANARELVLASFLSIKEVMAEVGWTDPSHFCREFKRRYGASPAQLRKLHAADRRTSGPAPESAPSDPQPTFAGAERCGSPLSLKEK